MTEKQNARRIEIIKALIKDGLSDGKTFQEYLEEFGTGPPSKMRLAHEEVYKIMIDEGDAIQPSVITTQKQETQSEPKPVSWRFGQYETYTKWQQKLTLDKYWGAIIAPTGWGKSFMTMVMIGIFLLKNPAKNILYITKRKDVLESQFGSNSDFKSGLTNLAALGMFPAESISKVWNMFNTGEFMNFRKKYQSATAGGNNTCCGSVFIFNIDKLTADGQILNWLLKQPGINIGALIFDEMHWTGAEGICDSIKMIKSRVPYGIGFSATPVRIMPDNQRRTYELFGNGLELEILHEVTYTEAWQHKIILPVKHFYFPIEHNDLTAETNLEAASPTASPSRKTQDPGTGITYKISEAGYRKLLLAVSAEIWQTELVYQKGIMYFESRQRLVDFYSKIRIGLFADIPIIRDCLAISSGGGGIHMSFSFQTSTDTVLLSRLAGLGVQPQQIQSGIKNFKTAKQPALLLVVGQAVEGFDDFRNELVFEMDYAASRNPLTTLQKIGRAQRIQSSEELLAGARTKTTGYYICPVSKKSNKQELCCHIAGLTKDYLAVVGADILDDAEDPTQTTQSILIADPNLIQQPETQQQRIKQIIQQNLYLSDGYEITADDILSEIRALGYRAISTAKRLAKFCREYGINSKDEYTQFRGANTNRFDLRPSAADYPGFGWQQVIDPSGTNYYPTRADCLARMKEVDAEFTIANRLNPSANKQLTSARKYNIIKFYNQIDPRIPLMHIDEFYGVERNK